MIDMKDLHVNVEVVGPVKSFAGGRVYGMKVMIDKMPQQQMIFIPEPITDRRVARRIARRSGLKFRWLQRLRRFDLHGELR